MSDLLEAMILRHLLWPTGRNIAQKYGDFGATFDTIKSRRKLFSESAVDHAMADSGWSDENDRGSVLRG